MLMSPTTPGPAYPEGEGDKIGAFKLKPGGGAETPHLADHINGGHQ